MICALYIIDPFNEKLNDSQIEKNEANIHELIVKIQNQPHHCNDCINLTLLLEKIDELLTHRQSRFKQEKEINKTKAMFNMLSFINVIMVYFFFGMPELVTIVLIFNGSQLVLSIFASGIAIMFFQCFLALTSFIVFYTILSAFIVFLTTRTTGTDE